MAIEASVGARVGDYILVKKLGEGGMAEVWLVRHVTTAQLRAIKFLNKQFQGIPEVEARFQTEGESQLVHPNIVRIYQVGQETGSSYLVMDYIDGRDLEKILDSRRGPLTVPESVDIGLQILAGLGFAHASGIIHRDIKPSNVLVDSEGQAYLMDFGIAKALRATRSVTQVNSRLGTPDYMSPEQIRNPRDVDRRSDIYSFGCMFYELLTGWPPFDRGAGYETEHDIKTAHVTELPTPPVERKSGLPAALNDITLQCLAKAKEDRPQSCEEITAAMEAYRASVTPQQQPSRGGSIPTIPRAEMASSTGPGIPQRRETIVIPPDQVPPNRIQSNPAATLPKQPSVAIPGGSPGGFGNPIGNQSRTPTVVDESLIGLKQAGQQQAEKPYTLPPIPTYVPPAVVAVAGKNDSAKGNQKLLIAAGSLLLLAALGGGGWFVYHEQHKDDTIITDNTDKTTDTNKTDGTTTPDSGTPKTDQTGQTDHSPKAPITPAPITGVGSQKVQPKPNKIPIAGGQEIKKSTDSITPPPRNDEPPPVQLKVIGQGTLIWTGDASSAQQQVMIIRSSIYSPQGRLSGSMFPAGPLQVSIRPAGSATVLMVPQAPHYNALKLGLSGGGQQTIYIDWKALQAPTQ